MSKLGQGDNFSGVLELTAPTGGVTIGKLYSHGDTNVCARNTAAAGEKYLAQVSGIVWAEKDAGTDKALSAGNGVKVTSNKLVAAETGDTPIGRVIRDAAAADESVLVELFGVPGVIA